MQPDDCLAIALLARTRRLDIAGISTVFGNAGRGVVDTTVDALSKALAHDTGRPIALWHGAANPNDEMADAPAQTALIALRRGAHVDRQGRSHDVAGLSTHRLVGDRRRRKASRRRTGSPAWALLRGAAPGLEQAALARLLA